MIVGDACTIVRDCIGATTFSALVVCDCPLDDSGIMFGSFPVVLRSCGAGDVVLSIWLLLDNVADVIFPIWLWWCDADSVALLGLMGGWLVSGFCICEEREITGRREM